MSWFTNTLSSSIGKKLLMSLTGLFLIMFLAVHLAGNLQLILPDEGKSFNLYAHNMANNPLIQVVSKGNFFFILLHVVVSILLTRKNTAARPIGYAASKSASKATWASRNMGVLGTLVLVFIVLHLKGFWFELKYGTTPMVDYDGETIKNAFLIVKEAYQNPLYVLFYVISMALVGFHLSHGFQSAFQTLGLNHVKYTPIIKFLGLAFSIVVPVLFALIPIVMYLQNS